MNRNLSIELLNQAVGYKLQSIHQYLSFHVFCEKHGYKSLSNLFDNISIVEVKHLEILSDRIAFLGGNVKFELTHELKKLNDPRLMLSIACDMERKSAKNYEAWSLRAMADSDFVSQRLFAELSSQEREHAEEFENEIKIFEYRPDRQAEIAYLQSEVAADVDVYV